MSFPVYLHSYIFVMCMYLSDESQAGVFDAFNLSSRYPDDLLNIGFSARLIYRTDLMQLHLYIPKHYFYILSSLSNGTIS